MQSSRSSNKEILETENDKAMLSKGTIIFLMIASAIYFSISIVISLHDIFKINFEFLKLKHPEIFFDTIRDASKAQFGYSLLLISVVLFVFMCKNMVRKKYKIHVIAGMFGIIVALASMSVMTLLNNKISVYTYLISGFLCLYCMSVPTFVWCTRRLKNEKWEIFFITIIIGGTLSYLISGRAGMLINEIFKVNASYFPYAKPIAAILLLCPVVLIFSLGWLLFLLCKMFNSNQTESESFFNFAEVITCYIVMTICFSFISNPIKVLELVSSNFDFNNSSPCYFRKAYDGYIVLDPAHTKVLTYSKTNSEKYAVFECKLKESS